MALTQPQVKELERKIKEAHDAGNIALRNELAEYLAANMPSPPSPLADAGMATAAGTIRGAAETADFAQDMQPFLQSLPLSIASTLLPAVGVDMPYTSEMTGERGTIVERLRGEKDPTMREIAAEQTDGFSEYESDQLLGQYGGTLGEFFGGALAMPFGGPLTKGGNALMNLIRNTGTVGKRALTGSVAPSVASETAGQVFSGTEYEDRARAIAALSTPFAAGAAQAYLRGKALGPAEEIYARLPDSKRSETVQSLRASGVDDISAGQELGSDYLMRLEGRAGPTLEAKRQLTLAAGREAGIENVGVIRAPTLQANRDRLGDVFDQADRLAGGMVDQADGIQMVELVQKAESMLRDQKMPKALVDLANRIGNAAIDGVPIDGRVINRTRTEINDLIKSYAKGSATDIELETATGMLEVLDNIVERQIAGSSPEFLEELARARQQYRAHLTLERAFEIGEGSEKRSGILSIPSLSSAAKRREGKAYIRGTGTDLADLAAQAQEVLMPLPPVGAGAGRGIMDMSGTQVARFSEYLPQMAARAQQRTLPMTATEALSTRLLERLVPQTGGLLSIR